MNWNKVGIWASIACAIHCALTPLVLVLAPLAGFALLDHWFEGVMVGASFIIASYSNVNSYMKFHRNFKPLIWMAGGFCLIGIAHLAHGHSHAHAHHAHSHGVLEISLSVIGALIIAGSLIYNQRLSRNCGLHAA